MKSRSLFLLFLVVFTVFTISGHALKFAYVLEEKIVFKTQTYDIQCLHIIPRDYNKRLNVAVLMWHGLLAHKETLHSIGIELAKVGFDVYICDLPGHGESSGWLTVTFTYPMNLSSAATEVLLNLLPPSESILEFLEKKYEKIIIVGHSLGGGLSLLLSIYHTNKIISTILIAPVIPSVNVTKSIPKNLLILLGENDEIFSVKDYMNFIKKACEREDIKIGYIYGSFANGTAREFSLVEGVDHLTILYHPNALRKIVNWSLCSIGMQSVVILTEHIRVLFLALGFLSGVFALLFGIIVLSNSLGIFSGFKRFPDTKMAKRSIVAAIIWAFLTAFMIIFILISLFVSSIFGIKEVILVAACAYAFFTIFSSLIAVAWLKKKPISKIWDLALIEFRNETKLIGLGFLIAILFVFIFKLTLSEFLLNILIFERLPLIPFVLFFFLPTFITHEFLWRRTVQEYFGGSAKHAILGSITLSLFSKIFVPILAALFIVAYGGPYMFALIAAGLIVAVAIICELIAAVSYYATREISLASSISSLYWAWFGIMFSIRVLLIISI